jgi:hypothetical protein
VRRARLRPSGTIGPISIRPRIVLANLAQICQTSCVNLFLRHIVAQNPVGGDEVEWYLAKKTRS